jgi:hypothetical protein
MWAEFRAFDVKALECVYKLQFNAKTTVDCVSTDWLNILEGNTIVQDHPQVFCEQYFKGNTFLIYITNLAFGKC